jgi:hypothetical protein
MAMVFLTPSGNWWDYGIIVPSAFVPSVEESIKRAESGDAERIAHITANLVANQQMQRDDPEKYAEMLALQESERTGILKELSEFEQQQRTNGAPSNQYFQYDMPDFMKEMSEPERGAFIAAYAGIKACFAMPGSMAAGLPGSSHSFAAIYGLALAKVEVYNEVTGGAHADKLLAFAEYYLGLYGKSSASEDFRAVAERFKLAVLAEDPQEFQSMFNEILSEMSTQLSKEPQRFVLTSLNEVDYSQSSITNLNSLIKDTWNSFIASVFKPAQAFGIDLTRYFMPIVNFIA